MSSILRDLSVSVLQLINQLEGSRPLKLLVSHSLLEVGQPGDTHLAAKLEVSGSVAEGTRSVRVRVNPRLLTLPTIEAQEILLTILAHTLREIEGAGMVWLLATCKRWGCDPTLELNPRMRWARLAYSHPEGHPLLTQDDRPLCPLCKKPVGSWDQSASPGHPNCQHYARTVLLPALRASKPNA